MENLLAEKTCLAIKELYNAQVNMGDIQIGRTRKDVTGDLTIVVFPLLRYSKKTPEQTALEIGGLLQKHIPQIEGFDIVKGFLNITFTTEYWLSFFYENIDNNRFGTASSKSNKIYVIEYSSPNTNKPLHLGHIRNNLLGWSIAAILKANGKKVVKISLVNDRGIHICKSMLAWQKWGDGETPESSGMKGDHLIGKYYVLFNREHQKQIEYLVHIGLTEEDAFNQAQLMVEAQELLRKWENADEDTIELWRLMNKWVLDGFASTYKRLGVDFDKVNYESITYLEGKQIVAEGLEKEVFYKESDGSVWIDLTGEGLDEKLLLRADGTSVYITQDLGTAQRRYSEFFPEKLLYVVGNEQIYHFNVLKLIMKKLGRPWSDIIHHLSYGMVELPHGRMKSREGTVVDADDLMDEMLVTAKKTTHDLGKISDFAEDELHELFRKVSMAALKYYILKVDPKKNMLFNPEESIDFNGNTGPFIQYTYARIMSVHRKAGIDEKQGISPENYSSPLPKEIDLIKQICAFQGIVKQAGESLSPALVANYAYELAKEFNQYYQETTIFKGVESHVATFRLALSGFTARVLKQAMGLLGIEMPEKM